MNSPKFFGVKCACTSQIIWNFPSLGLRGQSRPCRHTPASRCHRGHARPMDLLLSCGMANLSRFRGEQMLAMRIVSTDSQSGPVRNPRARRLAVFSCVFFAALALGLTYTAMQPAEYRATARLEIIPAKAVPASVDSTAGAATGADTRGPAERGAKSFLTEVQVLTSRPLLEEVVGRPAKSRHLPRDIGSDPVDAVQGMLSTETVEGTAVVQLRAEGPQRQFLA